MKTHYKINSNNITSRFIRHRGNHPLFLLLVLLFAFSSQADAGLKIYYIRHAQAGHNVKKAWKEKGGLKSEWPAYVGNPNMFTPKGERQVITATEKLKAYQFDFMASSPIWRARNTILPYLKLTQRKAEVWPELREGPGMVTILSKDIPDLQDEILNQGKPILLPEKEQTFFMLRNDAKNNYSVWPKGSDQNLKVAYMKHATVNAIEVIEKRFGGTDKSILLAGHNSAGVSLLKLLIQENPKVKRGLDNVGLWMVEQQEDGSYQLKMFNGEAY